MHLLMSSNVNDESEIEKQEDREEDRLWKKCQTEEFGS